MNRAIASILGLVLLLSSTPSAWGGSIETFHHSTFLGATTNRTMIDFDALPSGNNAAIGSAFAGIGLTIVQRDGGPINVFNPATQNGFTTAANANSWPNVISSTLGVFFNSNSGTDNFDFSFSTSPTAAGLWLGNVGGIGATTIQFLRPDSTVIASEVFGPVSAHEGMIFGPGGGSDNRVFYGLTTDEIIGRIRVFQPGGGEGVTFDDIQWGTANVVPTPSGLLAGGLGALGVVIHGWLRRGRASTPCGHVVT